MASSEKSIMQKISGSLKKLNESTKAGRKDAMRGVKQGIRQLDKLIGIQKGGSQAMTNALALQETALSRGTNLGGLLQSSTDNIENLEKNFTGYGNAIAVASDAFGAGLNTNNKQVGRLLLSNKLTEKGSKQLAKTLRANTIGLGLSEERIGHLADTTLRLQQQYGVTSQELQNAISELGERLTEFGALGIAAEAQEAAMIMGGAIGVGGEKLGASILKSATAADKLGQMSALGIQKERMKFLTGQGDTVEAGLDLQLAAIKAAHGVAQKWTKDSKTPMLMLEAANKTYGGIITTGNKAAEALFKKYKTHDFEVIKQKILAENKAKEINDNFTNTWNNVKDKILGPLTKMLTKWMQTLLEWSKDPRFEAIIEHMGKLVLALGAWIIIKPFLMPLIAIGKGLYKLSAQIILWIISMAKKMMRRSAVRGRLKGMKGKGTLPFTGGKAGAKISKVKGGLLGKVAKGKGGMMKGLLGGFMKAIKFGGMILLKGLMAIPVWGWILAAIVGIITLVIIFKKEILGFLSPVIKFFKPIYDFFVHGIFKIKQAFKSGFWDGIVQVGKFLIGIPILLWGMVYKGIVWLLSNLPFVGDYFDKIYKDMVKEEEALAEAEAGERRAESNRLKEKELNELHLAELKEQAKQRAKEEERLLKMGTANELLEKISKSMDLEGMRQEAALVIREKQKASLDIIAGNTEKPAEGFSRSGGGG